MRGPELAESPVPVGEVSTRLDGWVANYHIEDPEYERILATSEERAFPYAYPLTLVGSFRWAWVHRVFRGVVTECHSLSNDDALRVTLDEVPCHGWDGTGIEARKFEARLDSYLLFTIVARRVEVMA